MRSKEDLQYENPFMGLNLQFESGINEAKQHEDCRLGHIYEEQARQLGEPNMAEPPETQVVHCMRDDYDVYIGRRNVKAGLPESPFANRSDKFPSYEAYLLDRMLNVPAFAAKVMNLHGKILGCWCKGTSRDFSKCHGHIVAKWADALFEKWEQLKPDKQAMKAWIKARAAELREHEYQEDFLSKEEANALFVFVSSQPIFRSAFMYAGTMTGWIRRLSLPSWIEYETFRGVALGHKYAEAKGFLQFSMDEAPKAVRDLAIKLSERAGKPVNYFSLVGYANEKDHIDWHQHGEDRGRDARVFIVSLGETREFGLREICPECRVCDACNQSACDGHNRKCEECKDAKKHRKTCNIRTDRKKWLFLQPAHGSLIVLPDAYNFTHEHAVLDDRGQKLLRISFNTKCLPTDESLENFIKRMKGPSKPYDLFSDERAEARKKMASDISAGKVKPENETAEQLAEKLQQESLSKPSNHDLGDPKGQPTTMESAVHTLEDSVWSNCSASLPLKG